MSSDTMMRISFFLLERTAEEEDFPRFFVYGHALSVDMGGYLDQVEERGEVRINLTTVDPNYLWVPLTLIVQTLYVPREVHEAFLRALRGGRFNPTVAGPRGARAGFPVVARPPVIQLDANTARNNRPLPTPESGLGGLARVESFWNLEAERQLTEALNPVSAASTNAVCSEPGASSEDDVIEAESRLEVMASRELSQRLLRLTTELKRRTGLSFDGSYAQRLGNMECFEPSGSIRNGTPPITIQVQRLEISDNQYVPMGVLILKKQDAFAAGWAHIILRNNGETVIDRLLSLPIGFEQSEVVMAEEPISELEVRLFDESGKTLLWMEHNYLIAVIDVSSNMVTGRKTYRDRLSEKLVKNNIPVGKRLEHADSFSPRSFQVGGYKQDLWVPQARSLARMVEARVSPPSTTRWFPRTIEGEGDALHHIRQLIDDSKTKEAVLVDPFFGKIAFARLLPRLRNISVKLTVLTSCLGWDPDQDWARGPSPEWDKSAREQREWILRWCTANQAVIPRNLTILDLRNGCDQAFHDRYLLRVDDRGTITVKMLSTSLNNMAGTYPCCFVDLDQAAVREVYPYIRSLALGRDITHCDKNPYGAPLDREVIWSHERSRKAAHSSSVAADSDQGDAVVEAFPFQRAFLKWILDEPSEDAAVLEDRAREVGFLKAGNRWIRDKECFRVLLEDSWNRFPEGIADQARVLAALGEYWAHAHGDYDPLNSNPRLFADKLPDLDLFAILNWLSDWYATHPPPLGFKDLSPNAEALSAEYYLLEGRRTFQLLSTAESICTQGPFRYARGLYGLRRLITLGLRTPLLAQATMRWIDGEHSGQSHICAAIVSALMATVFEEGLEVVPTLLRSKRPFVQMFGVVCLFSEELQKHKVRELPDFDVSVQALLDVEIPPESVLWMAALPVPGAQAGTFRNKDLPQNEPLRKEAEKRLERLLDHLADLLVAAIPSEHDLDQLDAALRHTSRDRFRIAERCHEKKPEAQPPSWEPLFRRCVFDMEKLMGLRCKSTREDRNDFHFYKHRDYDVVEVGAISFVSLNGEHWATPFRNRMAAHVERVVCTASDPHLRHHDYRAWNTAIGQGAAGCLFGLSVCRIASKQELRRYLDQNIERMVRLTCQIFLEVGSDWYDIAGLLDRLAQEAGWIVQENGDGPVLSTVNRAVDDSHLPLFFRATMSTVPRRVFETDPARAFEQLESLVVEQDPRTVTRYFYLLDILIGNSHLSGAELSLSVEAAVNRGLEAFPDITNTWRQFFELVWDALQGDNHKVRQILSSPPAAQSYCGLLLQGHHDS